MTPPAPADGARVRLGLVGGSIRRSRSPDLHRIAGALCGLDVSYDLLVPKDLGRPFEGVLDDARRAGLRGVNITFPYKERVTALVEVPDPLVRRLGAVNTVVFEGGAMLGHNTDHSGFMAAFRARWGDRPPGIVAIAGAGGVGRAVAFGLLRLGASGIRLVDADRPRATALADALAAGGGCRVEAGSDIAAAAAGADGIVNCTPLGMDGHPGTAIPADLLPGRRWAFDAVYTPVETRFKMEAEAAGLDVLGGWELFFHQGVDAFRIFTGRTPPDLSELRRRILAAPPPPGET